MSTSSPDSLSFGDFQTLFMKVISDPDFQPQVFRISGADIGAKIYIPSPEIDSSISPEMMSVYLGFQKNIYKIAAIGKTGKANSRVLDKIDRHELRFLVEIHKGSSDQHIQLLRAIERIAKLVTGKMSSRQILLLLGGIIILAGWHWGWPAWLEQQKAIRLEEARTEQSRAALEAMQFASEQQRRMFEAAMKVFAEQGPWGLQLITTIDQNYQNLLRAARSEPRIEVNGQSITGAQATILSQRRPDEARIEFISGNFRVTHIDTENNIDVVRVKNVDNDIEYRFDFVENLMSGDDRNRLFDALKSRASVTLELAIRYGGSDIRSTTFLRVVRN